VTQAEPNVYVYGVLRAADAGAVSVAGVEDREVRAVKEGDLAALVSDLEAGELKAAKEVRAHWRVLEEASAKATVLPIRFGTVMAGDGAVRAQLLEPNAERLSGLLSELAGRVQLTVKGEYDEKLLLREVVDKSPQIGTLREHLQELPEAAGYYERIRLGELVASEVERRREQDVALAVDRLEPLAVGVRVEPPASAESAFNLAFLVERDRIDPFGAAVARLGKEAGERIHIRFVGPLPPYSFADANLSAEGSAWA
jgi:hypothetical protein